MQPSVVELLRDVGADIGMQPVGALEEEASVGRYRRVFAEQVLENRGLDAVGMRALKDLCELLWVSDEHEVARGGAHRKRVRERDLARLVDEQVVEHAVEVSMRVEPGRSAG